MISQEELKEVALCFNRDEWIRHHACYMIHEPIVVTNPENVDDDALKFMSPSGVHPFNGLALYNAPMCYLYRNKAVLYSICKHAYAKLWCRLNVISLDKETILPLCQTFENLLFETSPKLFLHLLRIGLQPLEVAFPWMHSAFINILETDQLVLFWDRLFGFMDINLLAVLATAIFVSRAEPLLQVSLLI